MVVRPTEIDEVHKFSRTDWPRPEVTAPRWRKRLSAEASGRAAGDGVLLNCLDSPQMQFPNRALCHSAYEGMTRGRLATVSKCLAS
jgi:hypothetical protein